jgi:hypothetical protein
MKKEKSFNYFLLDSSPVLPKPPLLPSPGNDTDLWKSVE